MRDALKDLGWNKPKASCYCALVQFGEMKVSKIAEHTGLQPEKVYAPANRLVNEGYAVLAQTDPKRYRAQNPRYVIDQEREQFVEDTDKILSGLEEAWVRSEEGIPTTGDYARILSGRDGMRTSRSRIIDEASDSLYIHDSRFTQISPDDLEEIESMLSEDTDIKIIARDSEKLSYLSDLNANVRVIENKNDPSYYIADESVVLLNVSNGRATVMFEDRYFARIITSEFEDMYESAERPKDETPT